MCDVENRGVIRRVVTPPAFPFVIRPCAANRPKHVASENPCSDSVESTFRKFVVHAGRALFFSLHFLKRACQEKPVVKVLATISERIVDVLILVYPETTKRDATTVNA